MHFLTAYDNDDNRYNKNIFAPILSNFVDRLFSKFKSVVKQYSPNVNEYLSFSSYCEKMIKKKALIGKKTLTRSHPILILIRIALPIGKTIYEIEVHKTVFSMEGRVGGGGGGGGFPL